MMEWFPSVGVHVEQMHLSISICILASYQQNLGVRDSQCTACPQGILHPDCQSLPLVLVHIVHFDGVVDLLLGATKEATKCVDELISN